ncbi:MAG: nucleotidyltransferase domain-containing protein [Cyanobacteriota bacterium]
MFQNNISQDDLIKKTDITISPHIPFFTVLSGAHIYGFASGDSDIDIRGAYLYDNKTLLGFIDSKSSTISALDKDFNSIEVDLVIHELRKYTKMITDGDNGYVLEQIFSPVILFKSEEFDFFKDTIKKYFITKRLYKHYNAFAFNKFTAFKNEKKKSIKTLLYTFRVLLTGIKLFKTGNITTNLNELNSELFKFSFIEELIEMKKNEESYLTKKLLRGDFYEKEIEKLFIDLEEAYNVSHLSDNVRNNYKLNRIVSQIYSSKILNYDFNIPVMRSIDDKQFIKHAKEKLLLKNSPFASIEKDLGIKISPEKNVFLPNFETYFLVRKNIPRGKFFEFIDIERFLIQIKKSNPFCLLALFNNDKDIIHPLIEDLVSEKDILVNKNIYKTFKSVSLTLKDKLNPDEKYNYDSKNVLLMLLMLIYGTSILKSLEFNPDLTAYMGTFKSILDHKISSNEILETYNNLIEQYEKAFEETVIELIEPHNEIFEITINKIKKKIWLND